MSEIKASFYPKIAFVKVKCMIKIEGSLYMYSKILFDKFLFMLCHFPNYWENYKIYVDKICVIFFYLLSAVKAVHVSHYNI